MEEIVNRSGRLREERETNFLKAISNIPKISEVILESGLTVTRIDFSSEDVKESLWDGLAVPIVNEGAQGVRVSIDRSGELFISFTNGF